MTPDDDGVRLQKVLAQAGLGSRRVCEDLIERRRVRVNGEVAVLGRRVDPETDVIEIGGAQIGVKAGLVHYLVNKPAGTITTVSDTHGRPTVTEIVPRPGHKASGEERAWGRRLAKRYDVASSAYDEQSFTVTGDGSLPMVIDHESSKPASIDKQVAAQFKHLDTGRGDYLIMCGWAMAEDLLKYG